MRTRFLNMLMLAMVSLSLISGCASEERQDISASMEIIDDGGYAANGGYCSPADRHEEYLYALLASGAIFGGWKYYKHHKSSLNESKEES